MLRIDLDGAGVPYVIEVPDGPLYADFHALRHSFIALLDKSGATLKEAMQLARHSDPRLTMAVYGRAQLHGLGAAVERLPSLHAGPETRSEALAATGTDGKPRPVGLRSACASDDAGCQFLRVVDETTLSGDGQSTNAKPLAEQGVEGDCERLIPSEGSSPSRTRTYNKPVDRRSFSPTESGQNDLLRSNLREVTPVCKRRRSLARACENTRKFRIPESQFG